MFCYNLQFSEISRKTESLLSVLAKKEKDIIKSANHFQNSLENFQNNPDSSLSTKFENFTKNCLQLVNEIDSELNSDLDEYFELRLQSLKAKINTSRYKVLILSIRFNSMTDTNKQKKEDINS